MSQAFDHISKFLREKMRMSHIYQPVMLGHLLERGGQATVTSIAKAILLHDPTQVEYYKYIVKRYPGPVLSNPKKDLVERNGNSYAIKKFEDLSDEDIEKLLNICDEQLLEYLDSKKPVHGITVDPLLDTYQGPRFTRFLRTPSTGVNYVAHPRNMWR